MVYNLEFGEIPEDRLTYPRVDFENRILQILYFQHTFVPREMEDLGKSTYVRQVDKSPAPYCYLRATLEYEGKGLETNALQFKHVLMHALSEVFGQVGASDTVDVLKLSASGDAILRVPSRCFVRLWGSLTLFGKYNDQVCAFRVQQISTNLMGLSSSSRTWEIPHTS